MKQVETSSQESSVICLTDEEIFSLVNVGLMIQDNFGTPRDIEWAMSSSGEVSVIEWDFAYLSCIDVVLRNSELELSAGHISYFEQHVI